MTNQPGNPPIPGGFSRRNLLALGAAAMGATLAGCDSDKAPDAGFIDDTAGNAGAQDVTGAFNWKRAEGKKLKVLLTAHTYTTALQKELPEFEKMTGIDVTAEIIPEATYFDRLTVDLLNGATGADAFMTGAYMIWQYGPAGWMEDLKPWIDNKSATSPEYDFDDIYPNLSSADRWDFVTGSASGSGGQWAIPWGWESNIIAYQADLFRKNGLKPPETLDQLVETAAAAGKALRKAGDATAYGIGTRGTKSWATIHPGFMTQFVREGGKDFKVADGNLVPQMATPASITFHQKWIKMLKESGPADWQEYTYQRCVKELGERRSAMVYDATTVTYPLNKKGATKAAGNLAWYPGPAGPTGSLDTNLWVWSLGMNKRSKAKDTAWLFIQWATGKQHLLNAAVKYNHVDPVRGSVFQDKEYQKSMGQNAGYLDAITAVRPTTKVQFTPQKHFFEAVDTWAGALQDMYRGTDVKTRLTQLAAQLGESKRSGS